MADVTIISIGPRKFHVQIREDDLATSHHVTVPESLINELQLPEEGLDKVVRESFVFLLEREPASSIMSVFSLDVISATSLSTRRICSEGSSRSLGRAARKNRLNDNSTTSRS